MPPNRESKGTRLTGINPLAYMGVEPSTPPQLVVYQNSPTNRDINYNLGTLWVVETPFEVWMLINKTPQNATKWILIYPQGDAGEATLFPTDAGTAQADAITHELNILGGDNINTAAPGNINNIVVNLNQFITWPTTNSAGNQGVILLGGQRFLHNFGVDGVDASNTFLGTESGNFTLAEEAIDNTGLGAFTLTELTSGEENLAMGSNALGQLKSGDRNISIGIAAGNNYTGAESDNIVIGNEGVVGESNTTRIGVEGTAVAAHVAGINGVTVAGTVTPKTLVNVDDEGQLGQVLLTSLDNSITFTQTDNGHLDLSVVDGGDDGALTQANFGTVFSQPFLGVQQVNATATHQTNYFFGTGAAMTALINVGGNFFPGNGAGIAAQFIVPANGTYSFTIAATTNTSGQAFGIQANGITKFLGTLPSTSSSQITTILTLTSGQTIKFFCIDTTVSGTYTIFADVNNGIYTTVNRTFISGYRIA